jgi:uncharacterized SAM-binding protein YcdF (DUF218 family)
MLFLNKLLPIFVLPLGVVMLLLLVALIWKKRWPIAVALLLLYVCSIPFVGGRLLGWMETRYPPQAVAKVESADAVVVLGGILGPVAKAGFSPNWTDTVERFEAGVALVQAGKAGRLIFTGARFTDDKDSATEGEVLRQLAMARGLPPDQIMVTKDITNTATEAAAVAELMRERHWQRVILVTTGWHMPRSAYLFKRAGVDCILFPVDFRFDPARATTVIDFVPKAEAWQMTETALRELYGNAFYRLFR